MAEQPSAFRYENGRDRVRLRAPVACSHCRTRKIRCSGHYPCANCVDRGEKCVIVSMHRGARSPAVKEKHDVDELMRQIEELKETIRQNANSSGALTADKDPTASSTPATGARPGSSHVDHERNISDGSATCPVRQSTVQAKRHRDLFRTPQKIIFVQESPGQALSASPQETAKDGAKHKDQDMERETGSIFTAGLSSLEYYGPRCFMSFCSPPGIDWVHAKVGTSEARAVANRLVMSMTHMIKIGETLALERAEPLTPDVAWEYTRAYFEEAPEVIFGVVDRDWFEARLRAHFDGTKPDDKIFYALRNVVWATGCRFVLPSKSNNSEASRVSKALFDNAMSAYTELLFSRTSLIAVQTLIAMAYYCEGIGGPSIQYTMCSSAIRLACSKGLHRQPPSSWNMSQQEIDRRNWLFWSIYCFEKQIAGRSGRPSAIEDDEISCQVPPKSPTGRPADTFFCHLLVDMMKFLSSTMKRLSSARALRQSRNELAETTRDLEAQLESIRCRCEPILSATGSLDMTALQHGLSLTQTLVIRSHYACLVLVLNTPLANPWTEMCIRRQNVDKVCLQYEKSTAAVAAAARTVILLARQIPITASSLSSLSMYVPMYSFVTLFIHILRDAKSPTVQADVALMEMAMGYFSAVEFATDFIISLPWVKDIVHLTRLAVEQAKQSSNNTFQDDTQLSTGHSSGLPSAEVLHPSSDVNFIGSQLEDDDVEIWGTFLQQWATSGAQSVWDEPSYGI